MSWMSLRRQLLPKAEEFKGIQTNLKGACLRVNKHQQTTYIFRRYESSGPDTKSISRSWDCNIALGSTLKVAGQGPAKIVTIQG